MTSIYRLYGLRLRSALPLPAPVDRRARRSDTEIAHGSAARFAAIRRATGGPIDPARWFHDRVLPDGGRYLCWTGLFEFLVERGGRRILARPLAGAPAMPRAFETYLLGQVLSFALLAQGREPLHATCVVVGGEAIGFLGDCGQGKSTLAAAFVRGGHRLLTDDLLVLGAARGRFLAHPGPARIKLFPHAARGVLGRAFAGSPMNGRTRKLVIPLGDGREPPGRRAVPLRALYVVRVGPVSAPVTLRRLTPQEAFVELTRNTFNACDVGPRRLGRQLDVAARMALAVPVSCLSYPRGFDRLVRVRAAVERDLSA
jgi:hypothetical protein